RSIRKIPTSVSRSTRHWPFCVTNSVSAWPMFPWPYTRTENRTCPGNQDALSQTCSHDRRTYVTLITITIAGERFDARLETEKAPETCAAFLSRLPLTERLIHVRWSGEGIWLPFGDRRFGVGFENATSYPSPGE